MDTPALLVDKKRGSVSFDEDTYEERNEFSFGDLATSAIDGLEIEDIISQMGESKDIPLLNDMLTALSMVLVSCSDTNAFVADQVSEAIASLNAFIVLIKKNPAQFIVNMNPSKDFINEQIDSLQKLLEII